MNKRIRRAAFFIVVIVPAAGWFVIQSRETTLERAYRLCAECGMEAAWVDTTVANIRASGVTRWATVAGCAASSQGIPTAARHGFPIRASGRS